MPAGRQPGADRAAAQAIDNPDGHAHGEDREPGGHVRLEDGGADSGEADRGAPPGQHGPFHGDARVALVRIVVCHAGS